MNRIRLVVFCWLAAFIFLSLQAEAQKYKNRNEDGESDESVESDEQPLNEQRFVDRLIFGGNLGASFGNVTYIDVSPIVGYRITDDWQAGVGGTYNYIGLRYTDPSSGMKIKEDYSLYGGRVYSQYNLISNLFVHGEFEVLNVPDWRSYYADERAWIYAPLVGGGYRARIGPRSYFNMTALYHLRWAQNQEIFPMYGSPLIIRMGFML